MSTRRALTIEAGCLELFAGSTRLPATAKKLIIIITLSYCVFLVAGDSNRLVEKCCPQGQVLSDYSSCSFASDYNQQIYQFHRQAVQEVLASCPESNELEMAHLEDVDETTISADIVCIDMMYDEDEDTSVPVIFRCRSNGTSEEAAETGSYAVPRLPTLRMCCGSYQTYDVERRDCVFKKDGPNVPMNFEFLNGSLEFVSVVRGAPPCNSAVLDYVVDATRDLRVHSDGKLEVVLATKDGPKTIIADENNTCLDPGTSGEPGLIVIRACIEEKFCDKNPCVSKCCAEDQAMMNNECSNIPLGVPAGYFHDMLRNVSVKQALERGMDALQKSDYGMLIGETCEKTHVVNEDDRWRITSSGNIDVAKDKIYDHDEYCVEMFFGDPVLKDGIYPLLCAEDSDS